MHSTTKKREFEIESHKGENLEFHYERITHEINTFQTHNRIHLFAQILGIFSFYGA